MWLFLEENILHVKNTCDHAIFQIFTGLIPDQILSLLSIKHNMEITQILKYGWCNLSVKEIKFTLVCEKLHVWKFFLSLFVSVLM